MRIELSEEELRAICWALRVQGVEHGLWDRLCDVLEECDNLEDDTREMELETRSEVA